MKKTSGILGMMAALLCVCFIAGCRRPPADPVNAVKKASIPTRQSIPLGTMLDGYKYFSSTNWKQIKTQQNKEAVEFTGVYALSPEELYSKCYNADRCNKLMAKGNLLPKEKWEEICRNTSNACKRIRKIELHVRFVKREDRKNAYNVGQPADVYTCTFETGITKVVSLPAIPRMRGDFRPLAEIQSGHAPSVNPAACLTENERIAGKPN